MAAVQGQFTLPLLAFQHHVGQLYVDPAEIEFVQELRQSDLAIVEQGRWHRADGKVSNVVCKVWRPFVVATPQDFRELLLEASKLHWLQHPNLTRFLGLGCFAHGSLAEVRESMFMLEQYVGKRTLRKLISEQMRSPHKNLYDARTALRWAAEVASALATLHEQQPVYVHNDVKADNVLLSDTPRLAATTAVLGDLKPHRHVYDREPSTLSQHQHQQQQQQRLMSTKAGQTSCLMQPKYTLERSSICSSTGDARRLSWSSTASSTATALPQQQPQQQCLGSGGSANGLLGAVQRHELPDSQQQLGKQQQQQQQQLQVQHIHLADASCVASADAGSSWSSACSTAAGAPQAATAAAAAAAAAAMEQEHADSVARLRSLPVPIAARRSSHVLRGGSCPTDWNPDGSHGEHTAAAAAGAASHTAAAAAAGAASVSDRGAESAAGGECSPGYFSAGSFGSGSLQSGSSGMAEASSCRSSAPPAQHSLAAEIAAADAAADAAAAGDDAAAGDAAGGSPAWMTVARQRSDSTSYLSDSASSTGCRGSQGKAGLPSLAADADVDDQSVAVAGAPQAFPISYQQHQQQECGAEQCTQAVQGGSGSGSTKGALATAFANIKQQENPSQQPLQGMSSLDASAAADQAPSCEPSAPSSPGHRLLTMLYRRSKSSPFDPEPCHTHGQMQLARSAPSMLQAGYAADEEAVHHGALLMPLQLSEPTGLCSLQEASNSGRHSSSGSGSHYCADHSAALKLRAHASPVADLERAQQHTPLGPLQHPQQGSGSSGGGCVYYGWELLPSGAASPCGAVHSSMLDLFADVAGEDIVTSRRYRDSCQYTLVPGSFVQQRSPLSITATGAAGTGSAAHSKSASSVWDAIASTAAATTSSSGLGSAQPAASTAAGSKWAISSASSLPAVLQPQQQQPSEQVERASSIGKGFAPSAIESKQHGGNRAFAALTAIDCIAEEGSSIATDSCAPSCCASRESTAHGGSQFFHGTDNSPREVSKDAQVQQSKDDSSPQLGPSLQTLISANSLTKALGLSLLLKQRSGQTSSTASGIVGLEDDEGDSQNSGSSNTNSSRSPTASPKSGGRCNHCHTPYARPSPSKQQLQLTATASSGSPKLQIGEQDGLPAHTAALGSSTNITSNAVQLQGSSPTHALAEQASSPADAATAVAAAPTKKVRFSLARPEGITASRDFGLLYAAPELVRGERPTEKVDVFAFGVLLYELLSHRLIASSVASVCSRNSRRGIRRARHQQQALQQDAAATGTTATSNVSSCSEDGAGEEDSLPEHQLLLKYAQLVAGGYRPPMLPHFPEPVVQLISSCWAAEPHERPRMAEVLLELQSWAKDRPMITALNSYVQALADMGYGQRRQPSCGCSCVIS